MSPIFSLYHRGRGTMTPESNFTPQQTEILPASPWVVPKPKAVLDREARERKVRILKRAVAAVGLAGVGLFSGLAAANTHLGAPGSAASTDRQVSNLENAGGGSFFSAGGNGGF